MTEPEKHFQLFSQIVESNGKTIRENNMALQHKIPLKTLVEVKFDHWFGKGACEKVHARMFVCAHTRDCDGTPLYMLCGSKMSLEEMEADLQELFPKFEKVPSWVVHSFFKVEGGFSEESLTPIEVTPELVYGDKSLSWDKEEKESEESISYYEDDHYCIGKYLKALRQALAMQMDVVSKEEDSEIREWVSKNWNGQMNPLEAVQKVLAIEKKMLEDKCRDLDDSTPFKSE